MTRCKSTCAKRGSSSPASGRLLASGVAEALHDSDARSCLTSQLFSHNTRLKRGTYQGNERVTRFPYTPGMHIREAVMRFRTAVALAIGMAIPFASGATFAHHSFASQFDNSI